MTYASGFDRVGDFDEGLFVFGTVLAPHENLNWEPASLNLVKVFRCQPLEARPKNIRGEKW